MEIVYESELLWIEQEVLMKRIVDICVNLTEISFKHNFDITDSNAKGIVLLRNSNFTTIKLEFSHKHKNCITFYRYLIR